MNQIKTAVIPMAGLGARFLPLSKIVPKELWPLVDRPVIQHIMQEAIDSGITKIIFVLNPKNKKIIEYLKLDLKQQKTEEQKKSKRQEPSEETRLSSKNTTGPKLKMKKQCEEEEQSMLSQDAKTSTTTLRLLPALSESARRHYSSKAAALSQQEQEETSFLLESHVSPVIREARLLEEKGHINDSPQEEKKQPNFCT